jgi:uncharacterized protein DUF2628
MTSYCILSNRTGADETSRVIGDRFSWAGFAFGGFWLLWHRAWFAGIMVLAIDLAIPLLLYPTGHILIGLTLDLALALLVGLEGNGWRIAAEERKGHRIVDVVEASDSEAAFEIHAHRLAAAARTTPPPLPVTKQRNLPARALPAGPSDMIGLVPSRREH